MQTKRKKEKVWQDVIKVQGGPGHQGRVQGLEDPDPTQMWQDCYPNVLE